MRSPSAQAEMNPKFYPMKQMEFLTGNPKQTGILRLDFISSLLRAFCKPPDLITDSAKLLHSI